MIYMMRQKIVLMKILKKLWGDATDPTLQRGFQYANSTQKHLKANISEPSVWGGKWYTRFRENSFLKTYKTTAWKTGAKASTQSNQEIKC